MYKLRYLKTGTVPALDIYTFHGGRPDIRRDAVVPVWYFEGKDGLIMVDSSFKMDDARELNIEKFCKRKEDEDLESQLESNGYNLSDVKKVIITHLHFDHIGGLDLLKNAIFYIHREELKWGLVCPSWYNAMGRFTNERINKIKDKMIVINSDRYKITEGVEVVLAGGHTPGSMAVLIKTDIGRVCLCSDNVMVYENIEKSIPIGIYHNLDQVLKFMEEIPSICDIYIPGHDPKIYKKYPNSII